MERIQKMLSEKRELQFTGMIFQIRSTKAVMKWVKDITVRKERNVCKDAGNKTGNLSTDDI